MSVGGSLTFEGGLGRYVYVGVGGTVSFNGTVTYSPHRISVGGSLSFYGDTAPSIGVTVGGSLSFYGKLQGQNPDWLLIPDYLNWMGVWSAATTYGVGDAVLYVEGDRHFAYASRLPDNVNHTPGENTWWYRIQQEAWRKV
jgi:hypothetical protein